MIRSVLLTIATVLVVTMALCSKGPAASQPAPSIDCETVRAKVAEYGEARAIAWAIRNGYSWRQIAQARKCLK